MADAISKQPPSRLKQTAITPIGNVHPADVAAAAHRFDSWLMEISHHTVNLERLKNVAGGLPVVGNVIALVSVALGVKQLCEKKSPDVLDYVDIGVDLIGVIPMESRNGSSSVVGRDIQSGWRGQPSSSQDEQW